MPIKKSFSEISTWVLLMIGLVLSVNFYKQFPALVPTHWNWDGQVDGYSSALFAAFFFPVFNLGLYLLLTFLPYVDPRRKHYQEFADTYSKFKLVIIAFVTLVYILVGLNGMGVAIKVNVVIPFLLGVLFIFIGMYLGKIKSNWFIGIRTPWTLSDERVWQKTHKLGGKIFTIAGICIFLTAFIAYPPRSTVIALIIGITVIVPIVYSYVVFAKLR